MRPDTIERFNNGELQQGETVSFHVKEIKPGNRLILTDKWPVGEIITINDFANECTQTVQTGTIVAIQPFGAFIRMRFKDTDFTGLLHIKEYGKKFQPEIGKEVAVFITRVKPEEEKIFLELVHNDQQ